MRFTTLLVAIFAAAVAAEQCDDNQSWCKYASGYGRQFFACDAQHTPREFRCREGTACCNVDGGIKCVQPGSC